MSIRRHTDPVYLQYIWNAIEACRDKSTECTFPALLSFIQSECDSKCSQSKLEAELSNAVKDGCVTLERRSYSSVRFLKQDGHDWYCFECHGPGLVVTCPTCFRVYHPECLSASIESHWSCRLPLEDPTVGTNAVPNCNVPPTSPCPVCLRLSRVRNGANAQSRIHIRKVFQFALDAIRNKAPWKTMQKVGYLHEPQLNEFFVRSQLNTRVIANRMRLTNTTDEGYPNRTSLLVELDNLVHNTVVLYGTKSNMSNTARHIRSQMKRAMRESVYCVDCYIRPHMSSSLNRITTACSQPHRLLWYQHNGWSFWPCKVLYESVDGYEVICFGGRHEREFVLRDRAADMSFSPEDLGLRLTPALRKALDEMEEYKSNQAAYNRQPTNLHPLSPRVPGKRSSSPIPTGSSETGSASSHRSPVVSRKRKAQCSKYTAAFGSTCSESSALTESGSTVAPICLMSASSKRLKTSFTCNGTSTASSSDRRSAPLLGPKSSSSLINSNFRQSFVVDEDDDSQTSSFNSDAEDDSDASLHSQPYRSTCFRDSSKTTHPVLSYRKDSSSTTALATNAQTATTLHNSSVFRIHSDIHSKTAATSNYSNPVNPLPTRYPSSFSSVQPKSQPIIRIKPLPARDPQLDVSSRPLVHVGDPFHEIRLRSDPSASSTSSSETVPAVVCADGSVSGESSLLSLGSSLTSERWNSRRSRSGRSAKCFNSSHQSVESPNHSRRSRSKVRKIRIKRQQNPPVLEQPSGLATYAPTTMSYPVRSHDSSRSSIHSDPESTALASSARSRSSSSSSDLSSSTVSSSSTAFSSPPPPSHLPPFSRSNFSSKDCRSTGLQSSFDSGNGTASKESVSTLSSPSIKPRTDCILSIDTMNTSWGSLPHPEDPILSSVSNASADRQAPRLVTTFNLTCNNSISASAGCVRSETDSSFSTSTKAPTAPATRCSKKKKKQLNQGGCNGNALRTRHNDRSKLSASAASASQQSIDGLSSSVLKPSSLVVPSGGSSINWPNVIRGSHISRSTTVTSPTSIMTTCGAGNTMMRPTPPSSGACCSSASSSYSSVSPAALSTTSGVGSSLSDPKSVDASPGEISAVQFQCSTNNSTVVGNAIGHNQVGNTATLSHQHFDPMFVKNTEERLNRIFSEQLSTLTAERDEARDQVRRLEQMMITLREEHKLELKRAKQCTWCQICQKQALYHCCPGTAYCSEDCQLQHWNTQHNRDCSRRYEGQQQQQLV